MQIDTFQHVGVAASFAFVKTRALQVCLAVAFTTMAAGAHAGPMKVYDKQYAWVNNFNDPKNIMQGSFNTDSAGMTVKFNYGTYNLWGYPAVLRGSHFGINPTTDSTFPNKVSNFKSLPCTFKYTSSGSDMTGDFAYDVFFRWDNNTSSSVKPQTEVMIWGGHNSYPIGKISGSNVLTAGGYTFDLWEGMNEGAGYYVYTFIPHGTTGTTRLPTSGHLDIDVKQFLDWLQKNRSKDGHYRDSMYLHVIEAGFEVVLGSGSVWFQANIGAN